MTRFALSEDDMSQTLSPTDQITAENSPVWVQYVPDGAVSVAAEGATLVLKASTVLQERFEALLAKRQAGTLSVEETREYEAIGDLDTALSWLNRLARGSQTA
jgi:predicted extracellular nuclease